MRVVVNEISHDMLIISWLAKWFVDYLINDLVNWLMIC